jgi:site-specific DNA-methyltransferase (adenine-specific)
VSESFLNGKVTLHRGDCLEVLPLLEADSIDSCVTDPPYHLTSIVKRFGSTNAAPCQHGTDGAYARASKGFMGKQWDGGDIAFRPETWAEVLRVLKPGAHLIAFSSTRTYHRMACAIEDAGFEIRDQIGWCYGSGFPKSHNIGNGWGTALKPAWEPIVLARKPLSESSIAANVLKHGTGGINVDGCRVGVDGGTRKTNPAKNESVNAYGHGLNGGGCSPIDAGRWPANLIHDGSEEVLAGFPNVKTGGPGITKENHNSIAYVGPASSRDRETVGYSGSAARFFYQVQADHRCALCSVNIAASASSIRSTQTDASAHSDAAASPAQGSVGNDNQSNGHVTSAASHSKQCRQPKGGFAQKTAQPWPLEKIVQNVLSAADLCLSCATDIARELAEVRRSGRAEQSRSICSIGASKGTILSRSLASYVAGRESTDTILTTTNLRELFGCVFHAIGEHISSGKVGSEASTEPAPKRLWYSSKADADDRLGSKHPTVKPLDLMQYLVRLVTPAGGITLDPFGGTGSTAEAAFREGMHCVLIEREEEYQADIVKRMGLCLSGPEERRAASVTQLPPDDLPMFGGGI